ncbi:MAG: 1-phosphofructokinase family hexose kinase [Oscillospiraceae bacterium]|nr:1-phosphofructokinase family hexose kinase [Oscillospiraceae bacterium]
MIITVTMSPALDKTARVQTLRPGGLNRFTEVVTGAGGKGVNVSKMIAVLGGSSLATGFSGGGAGAEIERTLRGLGVQTDFVRTSHPTRTNLKVLSKDFGVTEFNEPGPVVSPGEMEALTEKLIGRAKPGAIFVLAGSLPQGADADTYRRLTGMLRRKGAAVFLDADGQAFGRALDASPDFIKPNKFELAQYFERGEDLSLSECAILCRTLTARGIGMVALSMGGQGALFVSREETLYAPGLPVKVRSTVGAGDCMVGGFAFAREAGMGFRDAAALAMAASAGAATTPDTTPPSREAVGDLLKLVTFESGGLQP